MIEKLKETYTETTRNKITQKINEIVGTVNKLDAYFERYIDPVAKQPKTTYNVATGEMEEPENIYTKTCRMEKEFAEEELERTSKALKIAIEALETVRRYTAINQFKPKSREAYAVAKKAVADIKAMIGK